MTNTSTAVLSQAATGITTSGTFTIGYNVTNAAYRTCVAPCMTTFALTRSDTNSPPFYDFTDDVILRRWGQWFTLQVHRGIERSDAWPGHWGGLPRRHSATHLSSPIFGSTSGNNSWTDASGRGSSVSSGGVASCPAPSWTPWTAALKRFSGSRGTREEG